MVSEVMAEAGTNMSIGCPGITRNTFVVHLEWRCRGQCGGMGGYGGPMGGPPMGGMGGGRGGRNFSDDFGGFGGFGGGPMGGMGMGGGGGGGRGMGASVFTVDVMKYFLFLTKYFLPRCTCAVCPSA